MIYYLDILFGIILHERFVFSLPFVSPINLLISIYTNECLLYILDIYCILLPKIWNPCVDKTVLPTKPLEEDPFLPHQLLITLDSPWFVAVYLITSAKNPIYK